MASQCIFGSVNMNVYSIGRDLLNLGVVPAEDMTAETALVKLAWLLSNYKDKEEIKRSEMMINPVGLLIKSIKGISLILSTNQKRGH